MTVEKVVRGGVWLYLGGLLSFLLGYIYLLLASRFVSAGVVGSVAAVISLQTLLVNLFSFGIPMGLRRFIGKSAGQKDYRALSSYFFTSILFVLVINVPLATTLLLFSLMGLGVLNFTGLELGFVAILLFLTICSPLFFSLFDSLLRTRVSALSEIIASTSKLIVGIWLLFLGFQFVGVILGIIAGSVAADLWFLVCAARLFKERRMSFGLQFYQVRDLAAAGLASWIPGVIAVLGSSLGVLGIYGFLGGAETGLYYVGYAFAAVVYALPSSLLGLMFPVLSGMDSGRKDAISRMIVLSLAVTCPLAFSVAVYPYLPLELLGPSYTLASGILTILVLGAIADPIVSGYLSYVYAGGKYTHVAIISSVTTVGRLFLYALLIPPMGATGGALSYTLGIFLAIVPTVVLSRKTGFAHYWARYLKTLSCPAALGAVLVFFRIPWLIGIPVLLILSLVAYGRLGVITKKDLLEISRAFLSKRSITRIYGFTKPIVKLMFGD